MFFCVTFQTDVFADGTLLVHGRLDAPVFDGLFAVVVIRLRQYRRLIRLGSMVMTLSGAGQEIGDWAGADGHQ